MYIMEHYIKLLCSCMVWGVLLFPFNIWVLAFAFQIIFLETLCNDQDVLERYTIESSTKSRLCRAVRNKLFACLFASCWCTILCNHCLQCYRTDFEAGVQDFKERLTYYEKVCNCQTILYRNTFFCQEYNIVICKHFETFSGL